MIIVSENITPITIKKINSEFDLKLRPLNDIYQQDSFKNSLEISITLLIISYLQ